MRRRAFLSLPFLLAARALPGRSRSTTIRVGPTHSYTLSATPHERKTIVITRQNMEDFARVAPGAFRCGISFGEAT